MKLAFKLTTIALGITLSSCGEKKKEETAEKKAKDQQAAKTYDIVSDNFITRLSEMSDTLATIKDLDSARSALPSLTKIGFKMKMNNTDREKLGLTAKEFAVKLEKDYGSEMKDTMTKIGQTMKSLKASNPEAYDMIEKAMKSIM